MPLILNITFNFHLQMSSLYKSFLMGGFEGADHVNGQQQALDMVKSSGHLAHVEAHYAQLAKLNIKTVRESVGWRVAQPEVTAPLNLKRVHTFASAAQRHDIQVIWTFMHYGTPTGVNLLDDRFIDQFSEYARSCAQVLSTYDERPIINLINEISFLAWAVSQTTSMFPYQGRPEGARSGAALLGFQVKCRLVQAVLAAMAEVKDTCPTARFIHVEPLLHVVAPRDRPELEDLAQEVRGHQWQTWELLKGAMEPQLGGYPEALDLMGVNYYHNGQMEVVTGTYLDWDPPDPRRAPLSALLQEVWNRYQRPLIVAETGHTGDKRPRWLKHVLSKAQVAQAAGVPLEGFCIYPVIDRPCWHDPSKMIDCGLLDHRPSINALKQWQKSIGASMQVHQ